MAELMDVIQVDEKVGKMAGQRVAKSVALKDTERGVDWAEKTADRLVASKVERMEIARADQMVEKMVEMLADGKGVLKAFEMVVTMVSKLVALWVV